MDDIEQTRKIQNRLDLPTTYAKTQHMTYHSNSKSNCVTHKSKP